MGLTIAFSNFWLILVTGLFINLFGKIILLPFKNNNSNIFEKIFKQLFVGLIVLVCITSIIRSSFCTVNILFIIPLLFCLNQNFVEYDSDFKWNIFSKELLFEIMIVSFLGLLFYSQECFFFLKNSSFGYNIPHLDYNTYSITSQSLIDFGKENRELVSNKLFPNETNGVSPYHYFELWLNGLFHFIFKISPLKTLFFITYPLLKTTVFIGIVSVVLFKVPKLYWALLIGFCLMFITGFFVDGYENYELTKYYVGYTQSGPLTWGRKYLPIYIFSVLSLLYFLKLEFKLSIVAIMCCPIISIGTAPAVFSIIFAISLIHFYKKKQLSLIIFSSIFILFFLIFFKIFTIQSTSSYVNNNALYIQILNDFYNLELYKQLFFHALFPFLRVFIFLFPYLLIVIIFSLNKPNPINLSLWAFLIILSLFGALYGSLFNGILDSGQLLTNILPIINVVLIALIVKILEFRPKIITILLILFVPFQLFNIINETRIFSPEMYNRQSDEFRLSCLKKLKKNNNFEIIGYLNEPECYTNGAIWSMYTNPCYFLSLEDNGAYFVDLNPFELKKESNNDAYNRHFMERFEIKIFMRQLKEKKKMKNISIQEKFIRKYNIGYLYIRKDSKIQLNYFTDLKIKSILVDQNTGDQFIELYT